MEAADEPNDRRVFHLSDGGAHKFWSVQVAGTVQTVRFGRIGAAAGQTRTKSFASAAQAAKATRRLVFQKKKKGYCEVSPDEDARAAPKPTARRVAAPAAGGQFELPF